MQRLLPKLSKDANCVPIPSRDGRTILVQSMADREINVFRWDGHNLKAGKSLVIKDAGPESFATAWP